MCKETRGPWRGRWWGWRAQAARKAPPPPTTATASPLPAAKAQEVLQAIRGYVRFFFGCRDCASHFEQMAAASMHRVESLNSAVLWLWSSHNKVNARLAGKEGPSPSLESPTEGSGGVLGDLDQRWGQDTHPQSNTLCFTVLHRAQSLSTCSACY